MFTIGSDKEILSKIGITFDDLKSIKRQKRTYYKNIIQCLRKCNSTNEQQSTDSYLESIQYLCKTKDFHAIKNILNITVFLNKKYPETKIYFSEYLLNKGFHVKLISICEYILDSFSGDHIDLLEIEFLLAKAKSGITDRLSGYQLLEDIHQKTDKNSLLYLNSLVVLAHKQISIGDYKHSLINFNKVLNITLELEVIHINSKKEKRKAINIIKVETLEGIAYLHMIMNNWEKSLKLYQKIEFLCKENYLFSRLAHCLWHEGVINRKVRKYDMAIKYFREAKEVALKINDPRMIEAINHHYAYVLLNQGEYNLAEKLAKKCLKQAILEERDSEIGNCHEQIGLIKLAKNQLREAIENLQLSLIFRKKIGNKHGTASSLKHLSLAYLANKNYIKSYEAVKECLIIFHAIKVLNFSRIYRIVYIFWEWTVGKKRWTS